MGKLKRLGNMLRHFYRGEWLCGCEGWEGKPSLWCGCEWYDGWHYALHVGSFYLECHYPPIKKKGKP